MTSLARPRVTLALRLAGARARTAPATWAQSDLWRLLRLGQRDEAWNLSGLVPVPPGCDLRDVLTAGHEVLRRYETLRTTFSWDDDRLTQVVWCEGEFPVELYEAPAERGLAMAEQVAEQLRKRAFAAHTQAVTGQPPERWATLPDRWPIRVAVVLEAGRPVFLAVAYSHLALDHGGAALLMQEISRLLAGGAPDPTPTWQPADLAAWQQSELGRAANQRAIEHLRQVLRSAPPVMFDLPRQEPGGQGYLRLEMDSAAAMQASARLARRLRISTSSAVLLAAAAVVLAQYCGRTQAALQLVCANRSEEPRRGLVGNIAGPAACWLDLTGRSFDEIVLHAFEASVSASLNGYSDVADRHAELARAQLAIGCYVDIDCHFNDFRFNTVAELDGEPDLNALMAETVIAEERMPEGTRFFVHVGPINQISLLCDTAYVPRHSILEMLYGIERLLVMGASRDLPAGELSAIAGVRPAQRGPDWIRCTNGYVDLAATRVAWQKVVGTDRAAVYAEADGSLSHRLIAYAVTEDDRPVATLHRDLVQTLSDHGRTDVRAPDWYVRYAQAPPSPVDRDSWAGLPVLEEGTGRP